MVIIWGWSIDHIMSDQDCSHARIGHHDAKSTVLKSANTVKTDEIH